MWFFLAIASAIFYSFRGVLEKRIIRHINNYVLAFAVRVFALPFFIISFVINPHLLQGVNFASVGFWVAVLATCFIHAPIETIFYYKALEAEEITLVLPILTLGPMLTLLFATVFLREIPSLLGFLGVALLLFGIYSLKLSHAKEGLLEPLYHLRNNRSVRFMFVVMLSSSISNLLDKVGVVATNAYVYGLFDYVFISLSLFAIAWWKAPSSLKQIIIYKKSFFVIGLVVAAYTILNFVALQTAFVGYVGSVRASYILFTMLFGIFLLKEKDSRQKILAGIFMVAGLVLIKLFS